MKKTVLFFAVLVFTGSVVLAGGIDDPKSISKMTVTKQRSGLFNLTYYGTKSNAVEVSIYNSQNVLQFKEKIKGMDNFSRPYNFSALAEGEYKIVVKDGAKESFEKISHTIVKPAIYMNVVRTSNNRFLLTASDGQSAHMTVSIADSNNNVLFEKKYETNGQYAALFNLPDKNGDYVFKVTAESGVEQSILK